MRRNRQSQDGILGAFQLAGLLLAAGLLFEPIREGILLSGAAGIGFTVFILLGSLAIAIYRFVLMQLSKFSKTPPGWRGKTVFASELGIDEGQQMTSCH